jgi:CheY-like chemotaxis protein
LYTGVQTLPEKRGSFATSMTRRTTILIVDDEPGVTLTLARMLRLEGYNVLTASPRTRA